MKKTMQKIQASTLQEAYQKAAEQLQCSATSLEVEVIQYPTAGVLGFFKKEAIIIAVCTAKEIQQNPKIPLAQIQTEEEEESCSIEEIPPIVEAYIDHGDDFEEDKPIHNYPMIEESPIVEGFFSEDQEDEEEEVIEAESVVYSELATLIENEIKALFVNSCFNIDIVEVDVRDDTAFIFIDGEDAQLLIGKDGYRYNAFSYMLFHWLYSKYELYVKLEIAAFVTTREEMIRQSLEEVVSYVQTHGKGRTRFFDGILIQLALEYLRATFPDKYVAIKTAKNGKKYILINNFNQK